MLHQKNQLEEKKLFKREFVYLLYGEKKTTTLCNLHIYTYVMERIPIQIGGGGDVSQRYTTLLEMTTKQWTLMHIQQSKHSNTVHQYLLEILVYKIQLPSLIFIL